MRVRLHITASGGTSFVVERNAPAVVLGRDPKCDVPLSGPDSVSWLHARINETPAGVCLFDLASTNGTFLNEKRIGEAAPLKAGDEIRLAHQFRIRVLELEQSAPVSANLAAGTLLAPGLAAAAVAPVAPAPQPDSGGLHRRELILLSGLGVALVVVLCLGLALWRQARRLGDLEEKFGIEIDETAQSTINLLKENNEALNKALELMPREQDKMKQMLADFEKLAKHLDKPAEKDVKTPPIGPLRVPAPSKERTKVGSVARAEPSAPCLLLVAREGQPGWKPLVPEQPLLGQDLVVALPMQRSRLELNGGVVLLPWGDSADTPVSIYESRFRLFTPEKHCDADLSLERGRLVLSGTKKDDLAVVRLRIQGRVFEAQLPGEGSSIGIQLSRLQPPRNATSDLLPDQLYFVLRGAATVELRNPPETPPAGTLRWKAFEESEERSFWPDLDEYWASKASGREGLALSLQKIAACLGQGATPLEGLAGLWRDNLEDQASALSVFSLPAVDGYSELVRILGEAKHEKIRWAALLGVRHWLRQEPARLQQLADYLGEGVKDGALLNLMRGYAEAELDKGKIAELGKQLDDMRPAVRQLAHWHLCLVWPEEGKKFKYDPLAEAKDRQPAVKQWSELIAKEAKE